MWWLGCFALAPEKLALPSLLLYSLLSTLVPACSPCPCPCRCSPSAFRSCALPHGATCCCPLPTRPGAGPSLLRAGRCSATSARRRRRAAPFQTSFASPLPPRSRPVSPEGEAVNVWGMVVNAKPALLASPHPMQARGALSARGKPNETNETKLTKLRKCSFEQCFARWPWAAGMEFIAKNNLVHRDLAARNVLLTDALDCKVRFTARPLIATRPCPHPHLRRMHASHTHTHTVCLLVCVVTCDTASRTPLRWPFRSSAFVVVLV